MAWTKLKTAALTGAALLLLGGMTAVIVNQTRSAALAADRKVVIASVESLVSALARGDADAFTAGLHARNDAERRLALSSGASAKGMADLNAALLERFGDTDDVWRIRYTFCIVSCIPCSDIRASGPKWKCGAKMPSFALRGLLIRRGLVFLCTWCERTANGSCSWTKNHRATARRR
jgi:hypothetical protein